MIKKPRFSVLFLIVFICSSGVYGAINYGEFFPNGSTVLQSQSNGWTTPINWASKEIMTPEGCKRVTSVQGQMMFIPTRSIAEWNSFKLGLPTGVTISECYSYTWSSGGWGVCSGETGIWNYGVWGSCSVSCGGGYQTRTASCVRGNNGTQTRSVSCQRNDGTTVSDSYCSGTKPGTSQSCTQGTDAVCGTAIVSQSCNIQSCFPPNSTYYAGLYWSDSIITNITYLQAQSYCSSLPNGTFRVPTYSEIQSSVSSGLFSGNMIFWSSTENLIYGLYPTGMITAWFSGIAGSYACLPNNSLCYHNWGGSTQYYYNGGFNNAPMSIRCVSN